MARTPIHPGEILGEELTAIGVSAGELAARIDVSADGIRGLVAGERCLTADIALRLSEYFGTSASFWMNLQAAYDLDRTSRDGSVGAL